VEQQLATGLSEWQITELIENDEVEACEIFGETPLPSGPAFSLKTVHEIDDIEEAAA
jgi:hypothetical protein